MNIQRQMSLLEYALSEQNLVQNVKRRNLTVETQSYQFSPKQTFIHSNLADLEFLAETNQFGKQWVSMEFFSLVVQRIDEKFSELDSRLDNKEGIQSLNQKLVNLRRMQKSNQQTEISIIEQSQDDGESNLQLNQSKKLNISQLKKSEIKEIKQEEPLINRLNILEKKLVQIEEKQAKLFKEMNNFTRDVEARLQETFKQIDWSLEKFNKFSKELLEKVQDVTENHKEIFQHLNKNKEDTNYVRLSCEHFYQSTITQLEQLSNSIVVLNNYVDKHETDYIIHKSVVQQTENDMLVMIQLNKDILKIVYNRQPDQ